MGGQDPALVGPVPQPPAGQAVPAGRVERAAGHLLRALGGWELFQIALWTIFLVLGPLLCLWRGLYFAAAGLAGLGLFLANLLFTKGARVAAMPGRRALRWGLNLGLLAVGAAALGLLFSPPAGGWTMVPGTEGWSDVGLARGEGEWLALRSPSGGHTLGRYAKGSWDFLPYPGANTWALGVAPGGAIWAAPQNDAEVLVLDPGARGWRHLVRPIKGFAREIRVEGGEVLLVGSARTYRLHEGEWQPFGPAHATDVCRAGASWIMAGPEGIHEGEDEARMRLAERWEASFPLVACAPGGEAYAVDGGLLRGQLRARTAEGAWVARPLPATDIRVLVANPRAGRELWLGSWGEGVFRSRDGGASWENMGLSGFEIRALAVDFVGHRAWAAPANLVVWSGLWERSFAP